MILIVTPRHQKIFLLLSSGLGTPYKYDLYVNSLGMLFQIGYVQGVH